MRKLDTKTNRITELLAAYHAGVVPDLERVEILHQLMNAVSDDSRAGAMRCLVGLNSYLYKCATDEQQRLGEKLRRIREGDDDAEDLA